MNSTGVRSDASTEGHRPAGVSLNLEVVTLPVSDNGQLGRRLDQIFQ